MLWANRIVARESIAGSRIRCRIGSPMSAAERHNKRLLLVVNVSWFFISHRLVLAEAAKQAGYEVHIATRIDPESDADRITSRGLILHRLNIGRGDSGLFYDLKSCVELWRLYKAVQPDIIHHVAMKPVIFGGIVARLQGHRAVVQAIPGLGYVFSSAKGVFGRMRRALLLTLMRAACGSRSTVLIVQNQENLDALVSGRVTTSDRAHLIRGAGVDAAAIEVVAELDPPIRIVLASRMLWEKGIGEFVCAANALTSDASSLEFVLAGNPDSANPGSLSLDQLDEWNASGVVRYLGFQDDIPQLFMNSHIVCLPTYYGEGVPKVLIEAAACGRPIVTTNQPGCRDIVKDGVNGTLVPPRDVDALVDALRTLINDPGLRSRYGQAGRRLAESEFDLRLVLDQTLDVYAAVLEAAA